MEIEAIKLLKTSRAEEPARPITVYTEKRFRFMTRALANIAITFHWVFDEP